MSMNMTHPHFQALISLLCGLSSVFFLCFSIYFFSFLFLRVWVGLVVVLFLRLDRE